MNPRVTLVLLVVFVDCLFLLAAAPPQRTTCVVRNGSADCSHLSLKEIPPDLPRNITSLDIAHNQLKTLKTTTLALYPALQHLDAGYNSITKVDAGWCESLPLLQNLTIQHNQVHILQEKDLRSCWNLTQFNLASNRLKIKGEPFAALKNLALLDVSKNSLTSVKLGHRPQMDKLVTLVFSGNNIGTLKTDDLSFLNNSSLKVLKLLDLPALQKIEPGCFKPISGLRVLLMDNSKLASDVISRLCDELSTTALTNLSLQNIHLTSLANTTLAGLKNTNLTWLDLGRNNMVHIDEGSFQELSHLEFLSLEMNNLWNLKNGTFQGLTKLLRLNLWNAVKGNVENNTFQPLGQLEYLYLGKSSMNEVKEFPFFGLHSLRYLDLSQSTSVIKTITDRTFAALAGSSLKTLNLTYMALQHLNPGAFSCLANLTTLLLARNFISQTLTGQEFQGLAHLEKIDLSFNMQKITLTSDSFKYVPTVKFLFLGKALNGTLDLEPSPFRPLLDLIWLDLSNNNIANVNEGLFHGLSYLKVLKLQHNNLARVWKDANPGGPVLFLKGLHNLTSLQMDSCGLDEIPRGAFRGLNKLRQLSLSANLLDKLHESVFDDLTSLQVFQMQKNMVTSVPKQVFQAALANLNELHMERNPFDCTCESILWFVTWLNSTNASFPGLPGEYICNTPPAYYNNSILNFDPQSCKDISPFHLLFVLSSTAVLTLQVIAFLVHFQGWRVQFYYTKLVNNILGFKDGSIKEGRYAYNGYIVHAAEDRGWIERNLLPLEKEHFSFFLEDRDAEPGHSQLEAIVENMKRSRKIIFVVTKSLLEDPLCRRFTAHHALHQLMEDSRDSVVLVFLEEVLEHCLTRALLLHRSMLKPCCVLHWPLLRERIPAFRQKLRQALISSNQVSGSI